ncbi:AmmeMemoRadiSam system protein B [bacterium]|nr:AmmeMemoRadiSam system protein B [bacterium]
MYKYEKIRDSIVAGSFYPNDPYVLKMQLEDYLNNAKSLNIKNIKALICPHAGYIYSGQVAAYSYKQIIGKKYNSIIIISPSHAEYFSFASIFDGDAYNTPLGRVNIDKKRSKMLVESSPYIRFSEHGHNNEHSIEVQLPFLQYIFGEFDFIPIVIGAQNDQNIHSIGKAIGESFKGEEILIIASTDLSHYHPYGEAVMLDKQVEKLVENFDIENLQMEFLKNNIEMCGGGPVAAAMIAAKTLGANKAVILKYLNSGDVTGDRKAVVGYLAAALFEDKNNKEGDIKMNRGKESKNNIAPSDKKNFPPSDKATTHNKNSSTEGNSDDVTSMSLTKKEKIILLEIAKESIKSAILGIKPNIPTINDVILNEKCGAFVTITLNGKLRGCIGNIRAVNPLWETVKMMAKEAALNDPRFYPLTAKDLENINIEISVLSPFKLINNINEIIVGKHGLFIKRGFYQGLLLPQVATDYNWDRIQFLKETCKKAGLYENSWQEKSCEIYIFSATVFSEEEIIPS